GDGDRSGPLGRRRSRRDDVAWARAVERRAADTRAARVRGDLHSDFARALQVGRSVRPTYATVGAGLFRPAADETYAHSLGRPLVEQRRPRVAGQARRQPQDLV